MKKNIISIANNGRRAYQTPVIREHELQLEHTLFEVSVDETLDIIDEEEEEWPQDPGTGKPYAPW
ncbi:MAG: hypothetical protein J6T52_06135 [Bacteroidaceae bacterium]|nr:hypothetical protein [Bacteroidaceae bacterium]